MPIPDIWIGINMDQKVTYQYNSQYAQPPPPPPPPQRQGVNFTQNIGTIGLIAVCAAMFIWLLVDVDSISPLAMWPAESMPWMFVTSIFLHADFSHIFWNMFMLFMFGMVLERAIGTNRFLILFLLSGIVGNIGYVLYCITTGSTVPAIGASGALYGVFACLAILVPDMRVYFFFMIPMRIIHALLFYAAIDIVFFTSDDNIAHAAHLAGLIVGLAFGFYLKKKYPQSPKMQYQNAPYR